MKRIKPVSKPLRGDITVPGDKSIAHRAVILASVARGRSRIFNLSGGDDNSRTVKAFRQMGVEIFRDGDALCVEGKGWEGIRAPKEPIDCGNSGTTIRLLSGLLAGRPAPDGTAPGTSDRDRASRSNGMTSFAAIAPGGQRSGVSTRSGAGESLSGSADGASSSSSGASAGATAEAPGVVPAPDPSAPGLTPAELGFAPVDGPPTPTPEPGTLLLVGSGLAGLCARAWRRRRA